MYDTIKHFVSNLTFIMCVLGIVGIITSKINKPSGNSKNTDNIEPEDLEKTGYEQPEITENPGTIYSTPPESEPSKSKRPNILKQFGYSFLPHRYKELATVKIGSMVGFVTLLSFVSTLCILTVFLSTFVARGGADGFLNWIPEFELRNGILSLEEDCVKGIGSSCIYLSDQTDGFTLDDMEHLYDQGYRNVLLGGREKYIIMNRRNYTDGYYTEFGDDFELNRKIVVEKLTPFLWIGFGIGHFIFFVGRTFWYFGCAALYYLAALLITTLLHRKIPTGTLFRVAVYAKVPVFVVRTFWTAFYLSGIFRITITAGLMAFAIRHLLNSQNLQQ